MDLDKYLDTDLKGRHDTQHDDIQLNHTQQGDLKYDSQHGDS
jgi:hypothetical protein